MNKLLALIVGLLLGIALTFIVMRRQACMSGDHSFGSIVRNSLVNSDIEPYPAASHRLTRNGSVLRLYDAAGNTTKLGGRQFGYDDAGRMQQARAGSVVLMNYAYNGRGEQVRRYRGTSSTYTVHDESGHWLGDYDSAGTAIQQAI